MLGPSLTAMQCMIASLVGFSLNLNEVNYVSVTVLHVSALFIAWQKSFFTPGFLVGEKKVYLIKKKKEICSKINLLDESIQDYRQQTYSKINRNTVPK